MNRLLAAGFRRLRKDRVFWIMAAGMAAVSLINIQSSARSWQIMKESGYETTLEDYYFRFAPYMGLVFAVFVSLFLGTEYSDGTIRNKLTVGHTRTHVYLSNFSVSLSADLTLLAVWILCGLPGFLTIGPMAMGIPGFLAYLAVAVCFTVTFTALFTLVNMCCTNKAFSVVFSLAVWIGLILLASGLNDRLAEPQMKGGMAYIDGQFTMMSDTPNPLYVSGFTRRLLECLLDLLPTGQAILMAETEIAHPIRQVLSGLVFTAFLLFAGVKIFQKKDIR